MAAEHPPRVYTSPLPDIPTCNTSVWTHLFRDHSSYPLSATAFIDATTGNRITRGTLRDLTLELAYGLRNRGPRLKRGDVVMIFCPNSLSWPVMLFGAVAAGLKLTLASSTSTPLELSWQWTDSRACTIVVAPTHYKIALEMLTGHLGLPRHEAQQRIWVMDRLWEGARQDSVLGLEEGGVNDVRSLLGLGRLEEEEKFDGVDADETVYICYSSGTTGRPKGVESTHRGSGTVFSMAWEIFKTIQGPRDVSLALLPFYHIFGLIAHLHHSFFLGIPTVILPMPNGFDPIGFFSAIETFRVTMVMIAPPILHMISTHPAAEQYNLMSLKTLISGAAPLSPVLVKNAVAKLAMQGANVKVINGYGATETTLTVTVVPPSQWDTKIGSVGVLAPNLQARLVAIVTQDGSVVDALPGEPGEMWVKGPTTMKGYLYNPEATAQAFHGEWYKTGDILRRDDGGHFYVVDRMKELIKYKGMQIAPAELESLLLEHPAVLDVGVIGIPDPMLLGNELPRAYIVPRWDVPKEAVPFKPSQTHQLALEQEVKGWLAGKVAGHKHLRGGVVVVDAIPKSPTGKILRRELRERAKRDGAKNEKWEGGVGVILARL